MVRLVFRRYTHIWRTICTSVSLRASTRISSGLTLCGHSSPSFGSQQICSYSNLSPKRRMDRLMLQRVTKSHHVSLSLRPRVYHPATCTYVRLLGPCFKTGRLEPFTPASRIGRWCELGNKNNPQTLQVVPKNYPHQEPTDPAKHQFVSSMKSHDYLEKG